MPTTWGLFPESVAVKVILDRWAKYDHLGEEAARLIVVFERGVSDVESSTRFDVSLSDSLEDGSSLADHLREKGAERGMGVSDVDRMLAFTSLVGISWEEVQAKTEELLSGMVALPPIGLQNVARQLRVETADAADRNAPATHADRRRLDRTELVGMVHNFAGQVDVESMEAAVASGVCETVEYGRGAHTGDSAGFYEGMAAQPFHVEAGLVVRRPDVVEKITAGLWERSAVVVTGPSGIGKSAVLWTLPQELRGVLWFRVNRLSAENVPEIIRLARAYRVSPHSPVGFLVDSAGTGDFAGWERLRAKAAQVPGIVLVATAREEDLAVLGDLAECATVAVTLDENTAEAIYKGLASAGKTEQAHWLEAFENADGLTLEFAYLLTKGKRLRDVIDDQVARRVAEGRTLEIDVLALASTVDRWSASITTAELATACGLPEGELRVPLDRLREEHLVVEKDGLIGGLHQLRSKAICEAVHDKPPPTLAKTIERAIPLVPPTQRHRFIASMLIDNPEAREVVHEAASGEDLDLARTAACLQGLRLADSYQLAQKWDEVAEQHEVPLGSRAILFLYAIGKLDPASIGPAGFHNAYQDIVAASGSDSRRDLLDAVGWDRAARILAGADNTAEATEFLAVLAGIGPEFANAFASVVDEQSPLPGALREAGIEELAECIAAAREADPGVAGTLVDAIGGESAVIGRIRSDDPWITQLEIEDSSIAPVGTARLLRVPLPEDPPADPKAQAHALGRTMLWCLPRINSVDICAVLPGDHVWGENRLSREFVRATSDIAWNQTSLNIACSQLGESDTARLSKALPVLETAAKLTREICTEFALGKLIGKERFGPELAELHEAGGTLRPPFGKFRIGGTAILETTDVDTMVLADSLCELATALSGNVFQRLADRNKYPALAAYIAYTVIAKQLADAADEPWRLVGLDGPPQCLEALRQDLDQLQAIVSELGHPDAQPQKVLNSAQAGTQVRALQRAADTCRTAGKRRLQERRDAIQQTCQDTGLQARVFDSAQTGGLSEYRISVELDSLLNWPQAAHTLGTALTQHQATGETFLLVPLRHNRPVPATAMRLNSGLHPAPHPPGTDKLPDPHPDGLAAAFDKAQTALVTMSAIRCLPEAQRQHEKIDAIEESLDAEGEAAYETLIEQPDNPATDLLIETLGALAHRVQAEDSGTATEPNLAAQIATAIATGEINDDFELVATARFLALEWEIDPEAVAALFEAED